MSAHCVFHYTLSLIDPCKLTSGQCTPQHSTLQLTSIHCAVCTLPSQTKTPAAATTAFVIVSITQTKCDIHECKVQQKFHYEIACRTNIIACRTKSYTCNLIMDCNLWAKHTRLSCICLLLQYVWVYNWNATRRFKVV